MSSFISQTFEEDYFENYYFNEDAQSFEDYSASWQKVSFVPHLVRELSLLKNPVPSILVLGAATGECLNYIHLQNVKAEGIEISHYAKEQANIDVSKNIHWGCVTEVFPELHNQGRFFHMIYSSCLQFLSLAEIKYLLPLIRQSSHYFCHFGGYRNFGENELDLKLKTLESYSWWVEFLLEYEFKKTHNPYIWQCHK